MESDFSVFHRVDEMLDLEGPRFFRLAWRMSAYEGMVSARMREQVETQDKQHQPAVQNTRRVKPARADAKSQEFAAAAAMNPDLFERVKV